jgi:hypothetical protein
MRANGQPTGIPVDGCDEFDRTRCRPVARQACSDWALIEGDVGR